MNLPIAQTYGNSRCYHREIEPKRRPHSRHYRETACGRGDIGYTAATPEKLAAEQIP